MAPIAAPAGDVIGSRSMRPRSEAGAIEGRPRSDPSAARPSGPRFVPLMGRIVALEADLTALQREHAAEWALKCEAERHLAETAARLEATKAELASARSDLSECRREIEALRVALDEAERRAEDATRRGAEVAARLDEVLGSTSWRSTAPLRKALDALRKR